jgi:hypothetical protein
MSIYELDKHMECIKVVSFLVSVVKWPQKCGEFPKNVSTAEHFSAHMVNGTTEN